MSFVNLWTGTSKYAVAAMGEYLTRPRARRDGEGEERLKHEQDGGRRKTGGVKAAVRVR